LLSVSFPTGDDEQRRALYLDQLKRQDPNPADLAEAVERIICVRESRTYPPLAEILRHLREARADRLKAKHADSLEIGAGMQKFNDHSREEFAVWRSLALLGVTYCDTDREWQLGRSCGCSDLCCGESVLLVEAKQKLAWARAHPELLPKPSGDRQRWLGKGGLAALPVARDSE